MSTIAPPKPVSENKWSHLPAALQYFYRNCDKTVIIRVKSDDTQSAVSHVDFVYPYDLVHPQIGSLDGAHMTIDESYLIDLTSKISSRNFKIIDDALLSQGTRFERFFKDSADFNLYDFDSALVAVIGVIDFLDAEHLRTVLQDHINSFLLEYQEWYSYSDGPEIGTNSWKKKEIRILSVLQRHNFDISEITKIRIKHSRKRLIYQINHIDDISELEKLDQIFNSEKESKRRRIG